MAEGDLDRANDDHATLAGYGAGHPPGRPLRDNEGFAGHPKEDSDANDARFDVGVAAIEADLARRGANGRTSPRMAAQLARRLQTWGYGPHDDHAEEGDDFDEADFGKSYGDDDFGWDEFGPGATQAGADEGFDPGPAPYPHRPGLGRLGSARRADYAGPARTLDLDSSVFDVGQPHDPAAPPGEASRVRAYYRRSRQQADTEPWMGHAEGDLYGPAGDYERLHPSEAIGQDDVLRTGHRRYDRRLAQDGGHDDDQIRQYMLDSRRNGGWPYDYAEDAFTLLTAPPRREFLRGYAELTPGDRAELPDESEWEETPETMDGRAARRAERQNGPSRLPGGYLIRRDAHGRIADDAARANMQQSVDEITRRRREGNRLNDGYDYAERG
jgi:hypothetical protein